MTDTPPDPCTAALSHPDPAVREQAVRGLRSRDAAGMDALPALLALFGDPDGRVACQTRIVVEELGARAVPALQRIRRSGPGRLRPAALTALAELGGEPVPSVRDRAAVERLVRIKLWTLGEPLEYERSRRAGLGLPVPRDDTLREDLDEAEDEWRWEPFDLARGIAATLSIDPLAIGPPPRRSSAVSPAPAGRPARVPAGWSRS